MQSTRSSLSPLMVVLSLLLPSASVAGIPATPLMTVYQFDGPRTVSYYEANRFSANRPGPVAGTLIQGTSVIPCLVIRGGQPLTDSQGTPYVGFEVVIDADQATPASAARFKEVHEQRRGMTVADHHCTGAVRHVIDVRKLHALGKAPSFDPERSERAAAVTDRKGGKLDEIVRAFHTSRHCATANERLVGRGNRLASAWSAFAAENAGRWTRTELERGRQLDYVMRTAIYEGHLGRGCNAYGACERNVIALSIRNRGLERCLSGQGCRETGDFEGVASTVSQYNIWDEFLTQTTGLTSCFLRPDLAEQERYARLQAMYEQNATDMERILYGSTSDLQAVFPDRSLDELLQVRHYYHPPAMGKCFPNHKRLEYISGAIARRGDAFALIAGTRVEVGDRQDGGYLFQQAIIQEDGERDVVKLVDRYPGFIIDGRKIDLRSASRCTPYGTPPGCRFEQGIGRHRKTPSWLTSGSPQQLICRVRSRGEDCRREPVAETVKVGGRCDTWMQPFAGVP